MVNTEATAIIIRWQMIRNPAPDICGRSAILWAVPTVKGFITAPLYPSPVPSATMASPTMASYPMAMAIPTKIGINGKASSKTPMVEEAVPKTAINIGMIIARAFPFRTFRSPATRPLKAPVEIIRPMDA